MTCRLLLLAGALAACAPGDGALWKAGSLQLKVDGAGHVARLVDELTGRDYATVSVGSPLLSVQTGGVLHPPQSLSWDVAARIATLAYVDDLTARIAVQEKETHLVIELLEVSAPVELVVWGPYATTISETIGETVGVVRDSEFAMGIQALNPKTLGGLPWRDNDFPPQVDLFESGDFSDLAGEKSRYVLYRVEAAKPEDFGSTLQAYTRDRSTDRVIENWGKERYVAPAFDDGGVVGSKIALFGSPAGRALETLGAIEVAEGLPHPMIDGEWGKTARAANAAYLILDFSEDDADQAIEWTRRAGLRYLYHPEPFENWGHFDLNDRFASGRDGLRAVVERAEAQGIHVGVHTLSNFITTNDPYVTPVPDPRLAQVGSSELAADVDAAQGEIPVASPDFFAQYENNNLRTAVVGEELIQYRAVSEEEPWRLLDASRGAFGTRPAPHGAGEEISLLADHGYNVFLSNAELGMEMASTLADLFNETGLRQISFDGVEGNQSTGMGNYGEILFTSTWYDQLSPDIRSHYIADASRTTHYFWHIYTRMNWGEPWYAGFRESQTEYRLKNQPYFKRNLMPAMLGWFRMTPEISIEDVEWMLARSAAFDAGYAFVTSYEALEGNGFSKRILEAIGAWEKARMADVFSEEQKSRMEDVGTEFTLERADSDDPADWSLVEIHPEIIRHDRGVRQPGEPSASALLFENPGSEQDLHWVLTAEDGRVSAIRIGLDGREPGLLPVTLEAGSSLRYEGGVEVSVLDARHQVTGSFRVPEGSFLIAPGPQAISVEADLVPAEEAKARLEVRPRGRPETLGD